MKFVVFLAVMAATALAFWAGARWRRNKRAWSDYRNAKAIKKGLQKARWVTLKAALAALAALALYLFATGAITLGAVGDKPAGLNPAPSPSHPQKAARPSHPAPRPSHPAPRHGHTKPAI